MAMERNEAELTISEIHGIQLDMMVWFDALCKEFGLRYTLWAGTLLGCIRENGFIMWDDDVDIVMPREDYERLISIASECELNKKYKFVDANIDSNYYLPFAKLISLETELVEHTDITPYQLGVFLDIFPLDGLPRRKILQKAYVTYCKLVFMTLQLKLNRSFLLNNIVFFRCFLFSILRSISKRLSVAQLVKHIKKIACKYKYVSHDDVAVLCHSVTADKVMKKDWLFPAKKHIFENNEFYVPSDTNSCLTMLYGDYMTPPPKEKQVLPHTAITRWK